MDITCDGSASNAIVAAFIPTYQCTRCPCVLRQCFSKSCDDTDKLRRVDCSIDDPTGSLEDCGELYTGNTEFSWDVISLCPLYNSYVVMH